MQRRLNEKSDYKLPNCQLSKGPVLTVNGSQLKCLLKIKILGGLITMDWREQVKCAVLEHTSSILRHKYNYLTI